MTANVLAFLYITRDNYPEEFLLRVIKKLLLSHWARNSFLANSEKHIDYNAPYHFFSFVWKILSESSMAALCFFKNLKGM